jgi:hypothetical protein
MTQVILPSRRISSGLRSQVMYPQLKRIPDFRLICDNRLRLQPLKEWLGNG